MAADPADSTEQAATDALYQMQKTFVHLPASQVDLARRRLATLEAAIVARTREQVAREIEDGIPTWENMGERALARNEGMRMGARIARGGDAK